MKSALIQAAAALLVFPCAVPLNHADCIPACSDLVADMISRGQIVRGAPVPDCWVGGVGGVKQLHTQGKTEKLPAAAK